MDVFVASVVFLQGSTRKKTRIRRTQETCSSIAQDVIGQSVKIAPILRTKVRCSFSGRAKSSHFNPGVPYFDRPAGTCRCATSNFGVSYCLSTPSYLDGDGRKPYHGDRHPPMAGSAYAENSFEGRERQGRTCGVHARHLKKEHLKDAVPGII
jgi:hypothetical protein